jgi:phenylalanyl-tRNA synthetase beta chain
VGHVFLPREIPATASEGLAAAETDVVTGPPADLAVLDAALPDEREVLGVAMGGREATAAVTEWRAVEQVLDLVGVEVVNGPVPGLHPTRSARLVGPGGEAVGSLGEVDPAVLEAHNIAERVAWLEVDLDVVAGLPRSGRPYRLVSVYPSSDIDLAFEVADDVPATAVAATLREATGDRLAALRLFDVYRGPGITAGRRSLAYSLRLEASDHTLTDDEVAEVRRRGITAVESAHAATLRG